MNWFWAQELDSASSFRSTFSSHVVFLQTTKAHNVCRKRQHLKLTCLFYSFASFMTKEARTPIPQHDTPIRPSWSQTHFCLQRYLKTIFGKMAVAETGIEMWHQKVFNLHFNLLTTVGRTSAIKPCALSTNIIPSKYLLRWYLTSPSTNNSLSHGSFHRWSLHQISVDSRL